MALNLVAVRIDDRLIHGQGLAWLTSLPINTVVVVNDDVANSPMEQDLMLTLVPTSVEARFFSVQKTIDVIHKAADRQKIFMIFKSLADVEKCIEGGVPIKELNVGNIRKKNGSTKVSPYVNLVDAEYTIIKNLMKKGVKFNSKQTPMGEAKGETIDFKALVANK